MSDGYASSASAYTVDDISAPSSPRSSTRDDRNARRLRPRGSSVHTVAAMDAVDQGRHRLGTPTTRSVHYSENIFAPLSPCLRANSAPRPRLPALTPARPGSSITRPGTAVSTTAAAALASVVPSSGDRLKHLQLHMEQLQQLYAQEIHKEELGRREVFVQSMCTASITLWRYVCSKPRFFTAVKALMTQYLPANDARLYELEESEGQLMLVLADGRAISVQAHSGSEAGGVVAHAVRATSHLSATQWTAIQTKVAQQTDVIGLPSAASVSPSSSVSSSTRSSPAEADGPHASKSRWLDRHADCVLPSVNDHIFVLLPLDRVYRDSGFNPEIDLTIKKRDLFEGSTTKQLLVVVLRDSQRRPLGALEALVTTRKPLQIDFLDAFASLLAAALEARRSICRPTTGTGLQAQILHDDDEKDAVSLDASSRESPIAALEIAPGTRMVLTGTSLHSTENDLPLLTAIQKPMAELFSHSQEWQRRAQFQQTLAVVEQRFWTTVVALVVATASIGDAPRETNLRSAIRTAIQELSDALPVEVRFKVLFGGEPMDHLVDSERPGLETAVTLSVDGQFAAMECAIRTGDTFASTPFVTATPVVVDERKAAVLALLESLDAEVEESTKLRTLPLVLRAVELVLWAENSKVERSSARAEIDLLRKSLEEEEMRGREGEVVLKFSQSLAQCKSVEEIVAQVHRLVEMLKQARLWVVQPAKVRLFMAEYTTAGNSSDDAPLTSLWTLRDDGTNRRVVVFDRDAVASPRRAPCQFSPPRGGGGVAAYVLEHQEPLVYTPQHVAFDPVLRQKLSQPPTGGVVNDYHYYALPLGNHGVVEFEFTTEDQQKAFAANAVTLSIGSTIETVLDLHAWVSTTVQRMTRATVDADREQAEAWARWRDFVATTSDAASLDLVGWKATAESQLKHLISRATHVNVLVRVDPSARSEETGDDPLIESITREVDNAAGRASSPSLNVYHHTVLSSVWTHPLGDSGLLALSSTGDEGSEAGTWALETSQFGPLAAQLLSLQLGHVRAQARRATEIESLRQSLLDADARAFTEQSQRAIVARHATRASMLVRVGRLQDSSNVVEAMDDFVPRILDAITSEKALHAGLLVSSLDDKTDCEVWSTGTGVVCRGLLSSELRWVTAAQAPARTYQAPLFAAPQQDLVHQLWPHELITESSRLTVATLNQWLPQDEDARQERKACLVVLERDVDDDSVGSTTDEAFAEELAGAVARVFVWYHEKQRERSVNGQLMEMTDAWQRTRADLQTAHESHDAWAQIWRRVLERLLAVGTATTCEDTEWTVLRDELTLAIQHHVREQIGNSHEWLTPLEVRLVAGHGPSEKVLTGVLSDWMLPQEVGAFLSHQRRLHTSTDALATVECYGSATDHVFAVSRTVRRHEDSGAVSIVAVHLADAIKCRTTQAAIETVLADALELAVVVENILDLHDRVRQSALETRTATERLEEVQSLVARAAADATRRSRVHRQLVSILDSRGDDAARVEALCLEPDYCLWVCKQEDDVTTISSVQHDGTKRVRKYEPMAWPHSVEILSVHGKRRGVVERVDATTSDEELRLVASAIQSAMARGALEHDVRDLRTEERKKDEEATETAERQDRQRREIVIHWHTVDALLQASIDSSDTARDRTAIWAETLVNVTGAIQQTVATDVACVRIVFLTVDVKSRRVVETTDLNSSISDAPLLRWLTALHGLWNHDDEAPRTKIVPCQDDSVRDLVQCLFSSATPATIASSRLVVVTAPTSRVSHEPVRSFAVLVGLSTVASLPTDTLHTLEIDLMLIATAYERWHSHCLAWHRALEAETALGFATQQAAETEQWVAYMETVQSAARQLMHEAVDASNDNVSPGPSGWMRQVEAFVRTACACDAVALYPLEEDGTISPLCVRDHSLSPSLESLLKTPFSPSGPLSVETTHSGHRLVTAIHNRENSGMVLGVLVMDWHRDSTVPSIDVVHTVVHPWLAITLSVIHARDTARIAHTAMARQLTTLTHEKTEWDLEVLELKRHVAQAANRHGTLQKTVHVAKDLLQHLETLVPSIASAADAMALWTAVAKHVASLHSVHGVQLLEATDPSVVILSTLSNGDDANLHKALESGGLVRRCLASQQTQDCRVMCGSSSDYKRVRLVRLNSGDFPRALVLVVCTSDAETTHQQLDMVEHAVDLCVVVASQRAAEIERMVLDTAATSALELAVEDLSTRLQSTSESLVVSERSRSWHQSLFCGALARDLVGHDVWRCVEKTAQASSTTLPTAKLTAMWKFLQDTATRRLEHVLASGLTLQLYGVVTEGSFVFSMPSSSMDAPARKGFFCVTLQQLEQRREWRKMAQCIRTGKSHVYGPAVYFPVRKDENCQPRAETDARDGSEEEEDEEDGGREKGVVGVLLVKMKAPIVHGLGAELSELVQEWVDTMASRVEWIGRVVGTKQQHTTRQSQSTKPSQLRPTNDPAVRIHGTDGSSVNPLISEPDVAVEMSHPTWVSNINSNSPVVFGCTRSNQDEVSGHGDVDSDDERDAERTRERRRLAVAHGVLDFAFRVQSLHVGADSNTDKEDAAAALRQLVARELKNVWRARGDDRKHALDACELYFGLEGVLSGSPHDSQRKPTTAPAWAAEVASRQANSCADASGCRLWKVDAWHWMATLALGNAMAVVVTLTGSSALSCVFDDDDESVHLPSLLRAMGFQTMRIVESLACRASQREQLLVTQDAAAQRDVAWQHQVDELTQCATREREVFDVAMKLLCETDERVVVKSALDTMQRFTRCGHVDFQPAVATTGGAVTSQYRNDPSAVAMETVLRVPVVAAGENELLGTLVARLTDHERKAMETDGTDWILSLLQRLADATAIAIVGLRQRDMLHQAETTLVAASTGLETHQQELLALQMENERLNFTLNELTKETEQIQSVEQESVRFQRQLTKLREQLRTSDEARQEMATQLRQYEAQFIEINTQLEKSLDAETQLLRLEETHSATLAREARLEKKRRKQKLQLEHLMAERLARVEKDERDQAELVELRRQVAVLTEKQQHSNHGGGMDASSVATAVLQAQAQAMAQTQAYQQQQQSHAEWKQQQQQQKEQRQARVHSATVQRRMVRHWQLQQHQQQLQKRKQLDLAHELRQLAALEVQEMTRRDSSSSECRHSSPRKRTRQVATWRVDEQDGGASRQAKVHDVRTAAPISKPPGSETVGRAAGSTGSKPTGPAVSRLQPPRIAVAERRAPLPEN